MLDIHVDRDLLVHIMHLDQNIKKRREALGLTQKQLAKKVGKKNRFWIANLESGRSRPNGEDLVALARALNCTAESLVES